MSGQFDAFHALESEKKDRIINAALDEIALKGFKKASTNTIVKQAGISKGMLFYYFGSKEELFDFLCEYTIEFAKREYVGKFTSRLKTRDFIERCRALAEQKSEVLSNYPHIIKFYESFFIPGNEAYFIKYSQTIQEINHTVRAGLYDDLDYSLFRDGIKPEKSLVYIRWLTERYEKELMDKLVDEGGILRGDVDAAFADYYGFLADLKRAFYKDDGRRD